MYLSSRSNPKIKYIRSLHQKKQRDQQKQFLIEGRTLVLEALAAGWPLFQLVIREDQRCPPVPPDLEVLRVPEAVMTAITTLASAPEYLAVAFQQALKPAAGGRSCLLVTAPLQDPGNLGALLRLADAFSLAGIQVLGAGVDPWHPKVIRGAMGSALRVPVEILESVSNLQALQAQGWTLVAADAQGGRSSFELRFPERTVLLLGSEGPGLPQSLLQVADVHVRIPISRRVESLNVVTAAAMLLHEYGRQYPLE